MTQQEHLLLIRAKCVELLELAKRRTPGEWYESQNHYAIFSRHDYKRVAHADKDSGDAAFIASAAGPFEAALASTVAAIDECLESLDDLQGSMPYNLVLVEQIITSWPLELLQQ